MEQYYTAEMKAWLKGYVPTVADEMMKPQAGKPQDPVRAEEVKIAASNRASASMWFNPRSKPLGWQIRDKR
jgi:hypothetical protein